MKIILIVLISVMILPSSFVFADNNSTQYYGYFPAISRSDVCSNYDDGFWIGPGNSMSKPHPGQKGEYYLEIADVLNGYAKHGFLKSGTTLTYLVNQTRGKGLMYREKFSLYTYDCIKKKATRIVSPLQFQKIYAELDDPKGYDPYQVLWYSKNIITIRLEQKVEKYLNNKCRDTADEVSIMCKYGYYEIHIDPAKKIFTLLKRTPYNETQENQGSYKY